MIKRELLPENFRTIFMLIGIRKREKAMVIHYYYLTMLFSVFTNCTCNHRAYFCWLIILKVLFPLFLSSNIFPKSSIIPPKLYLSILKGTIWLANTYTEVCCT